MNMAQLKQTRRDNLRWLVNKYGAASIARMLGHSNSSYIHQMVGPNPIRGVSEGTARALERAFSLAPDTLDMPLESLAAELDK